MKYSPSQSLHYLFRKQLLGKYRHYLLRTSWRTEPSCGLWLVAAVFLLVAAPVWGGIESRPINTDDAGTLDKGTFSVSTGVVYAEERNADKQTDLVTNLSYAPFEGIEIGTEFSYSAMNSQSASDVHGIGDVLVRVEWNYLKRTKQFPDLSAALQWEDDLTVTLLGSRELGPVAVHLNVGYVFAGRTEGVDREEDSVTYNIALDGALTERLGLGVEAFGQSNKDSTAADSPLEFLVGAVFDVTDAVAFDMGLGAGLTNASPDLRVTIGLTATY